MLTLKLCSSKQLVCLVSTDACQAESHSFANIQITVFCIYNFMSANNHVKMLHLSARNSFKSISTHVETLSTDPHWGQFCMRKCFVALKYMYTSHRRFSRVFLGGKIDKILGWWRCNLPIPHMMGGRRANHESESLWFTEHRIPQGCLTSATSFSRISHSQSHRSAGWWCFVH